MRRWGRAFFANTLTKQEYMAKASEKSREKERSAISYQRSAISLKQNHKQESNSAHTKTRRHKEKQTSHQQSAFSSQLEARAKNENKNQIQLTQRHEDTKETKPAIGSQRSAVSLKQERKTKTRIKFSSHKDTETQRETNQPTAVSVQPSAGIKIEQQIQNPLFPKFPASGGFLLKRPKGTKSRRWARGLPYAPRESPSQNARNPLP